MIHALTDPDGAAWPAAVSLQGCISDAISELRAIEMLTADLDFVPSNSMQAFTCDFIV